MIAPIIIGLPISVFETGISFRAHSNLQAAVEAGRLFPTRQAQTSGLTESGLVYKICSSIKAPSICGNVMVDAEHDIVLLLSRCVDAGLDLRFDSSGDLHLKLQWWNRRRHRRPASDLAVAGHLRPALADRSDLSNGSSELMGVTAFCVEP